METKYKVGDVVTVKSPEQLDNDFKYTRGIGYADPITNIVFTTGMEKTCGKTFSIKKIEKMGEHNPITLYYLGVKSEFSRDYNYAYVESFFIN